MIRRCGPADFESIFQIINDSAQAYKGIIPEDRWHEPYMPRGELRHEISDGVIFWGFELDAGLAGVMGIQDKGRVCLIRHAYVLPVCRRQRVGTRLLKHLESTTSKPMLIGTWAAASWAVAFYVKNGYRVVTEQEKNRLLLEYWSIPERQVQTSVVLADDKWVDL